MHLCSTRTYSAVTQSAQQNTRGLSGVRSHGNGTQDQEHGSRSGAKPRPRPRPRRPSSESCSSCHKPPPAPASCSPTPSGKCPVNALKLGACASVLGGLVSLELGYNAGSTPSSSSLSKKQPCCELLGGLADLDAAVCLCTALRANVLGVVQLSLPVELSVLVNHCGKKVPAGFQCSS